MKSTLKLLSLGIILLFLATSTINLVRSEGGSMTLVENVKSAIKDRQPIDTKLSEIYNKYHVSIAIVILGEAYNKDSAEATFRARRLDREGIPTLNVLIYYGVENKKLFVVYSEERGYDKETADRITKAISEDISNKDLDTALLNSLSTLEIEIPKAIQRALQGGNDLLSKETCKSFYEGDKGDGKRLRFLFVGSGFSSEQDFKSFIEVAIDDGFKKIEPFKKYTGDGTNGKFQFLYSPAYDLKENGNGGYTGLEKQRQNCPNTVYTMLIDKNWDQQNYDGIYIGGTSLSSPQPNVVIHETGHHFGLNDEYLLSSSLHYDKAKIVNIAKYQKDWTNCAEDPKIWKDYLSPLSDNYSFKGCSLENLYRSSENSIMKGAAGSNKFNFLSCLILVSKLEGKNIGDKDVNDICKTMYDKGDLVTYDSKTASTEKLVEPSERISITSDSKLTEIKLDKDMLFSKQGYIISKEGFTLDCQNHKISSTEASSTSYGIEISAKNVIIKNCIISKFFAGIAISGADNTKISNTAAYENTAALVLSNSDNTEAQLVGGEYRYYNKIIDTGNKNTKITYIK